MMRDSKAPFIASSSRAGLATAGNKDGASGQRVRQRAEEIANACGRVSYEQIMVRERPPLPENHVCRMKELCIPDIYSLNATEVSIFQDGGVELPSDVEEAANSGEEAAWCSTKVRARGEYVLS